MKLNRITSAGHSSNTPVSCCTGIISDSLYIDAIEFTKRIKRFDNLSESELDIVHDAMVFHMDSFIIDYKKAIKKVIYKNKESVFVVPLINGEAGDNPFTTNEDFQCKKCLNIFPNSERVTTRLGNGYIKRLNRCKSCNQKINKGYEIKKRQTDPAWVLRKRESWNRKRKKFDENNPGWRKAYWVKWNEQRKLRLINE